MIARAACIGGGVIGGGWVSRLVLSGVDVAIFDPAPDAERIVGEVLENARRAYANLTMAPLPPEGRVTFLPSIEEAVDGAELVQESVPERLDLKRSVLTAIDAATGPEVLIGSSTSGLLPSDLQLDMARPKRFFVAHPYNPVYLLPLVELVGGKATSPETIERAKVAYASLGMKGVHIAREIPAFVGDRLLEALWREALWLIRDDICDVETLDDVMRFSFGLRWAQMGLFQSYRIAGGEAGMGHFLEQFGPCLDWPWSRLTDVPDLDAELIAKIARQSDAQARGLSIRELERVRDDNLVGIMQALKGADWGAGALLKSFEDRLWAAAKTPEPDLSGPLALHQTRVSPAWLDYNGHMTEFRYLQVFGDTTDAFLRLIGIDPGAADEASYYTVETHLQHLKELRQGTDIETETIVLSAEGKRLHLYHEMFAEGALVATAEHLLLHVSNGRATEPSEAISARIAPIVEAHASLPRPYAVGRHVGLKRPTR